MSTFASTWKPTLLRLSDMAYGAFMMLLVLILLVFVALPSPKTMDQWAAGLDRLTEALQAGAACLEAHPEPQK